MQYTFLSRLDLDVVAAQPQVCCPLVQAGGNGRASGPRSHARWASDALWSTRLGADRNVFGVGDLDLRFEALRRWGGGVESQRNGSLQRLLFGVERAHDQVVGHAKAVDLRT